MSDQSEEKTLPASQRKLTKAREKGQVVTSRETVMSLAGVAALLYLYATRVSITEKLRALWTLEPDFEGQPFLSQLQAKVEVVLSLGLGTVMPVVALVIGVGVLGGMAVAGGPVLSFEPLVPKFEKISPASGFKKIVGRRAMMSFLFHVIRLALLGAIFTLVLLGGWQAMMLAPVCGLGCAMETMDGVLLPLVVGAVAAMLVMALADYLIQRAEFMREQKMTLTEYKKEMKEQMGDPHMRGQIKRDRREMLTSQTGPGLATLILTAGRDAAIGIRYREGETPAPMVVARVRGAPAIRAMAAKSKALQLDEAALVGALRKVAVGGYITEDDAIAKLAPLLHRAGTTG